MNRLMVKPIPQSSDDAVDLQPRCIPADSLAQSSLTATHVTQKHPDLLADEQARRDAERTGRSSNDMLIPQRTRRHWQSRRPARSGTRPTGAGHAPGRGAARPDRPADRVRPERDRQREERRRRGWRERRTSARRTRAPHRPARYRRQALDAGPVQRREQARCTAAKPKPRERQVGRVEHGDDRDRAEVVDDRERGQEHLERDRHARRRAARARRARRRCRWRSGSPSPASVSGVPAFRAT